MKTIITELALWDNTKAIKGITHDRDIKEDGTAAETHIHIILRLKQHRYRSTVKNKIQKVNNRQYVNAEKVKNIISSVRYLRHLDNPEKFQYPENDVVSYGELEEEEENVYYKIFEDMKARIRPATLLKTYGKDYVRNFSQLREIITEDKEWMNTQYLLERERKHRKKIEELEEVQESIDDLPF